MNPIDPLPATVIAQRNGWQQSITTPRGALAPTGEDYTNTATRQRRPLGLEQLGLHGIAGERVAEVERPLA